MIHRHLQVRPGTPVEELPLAALVDILERGDLDDWKPVAAAIRRDPQGPFAQQVMRLVDAHPLYGVSPLWRSWIDRWRARDEKPTGPRRLRGLAALRRELGLTQTELASRLGISQSDLSKFERRGDVLLSTLRAYLEALGGNLRILFDSSGDPIEIEWGESHPSRKPIREA